MKFLFLETTLNQLPGADLLYFGLLFDMGEFKDVAFENSRRYQHSGPCYGMNQRFGIVDNDGPGCDAFLKPFNKSLTDLGVIARHRSDFFDYCWGFHDHPDTHSTNIRTLIPR